ncbi:MAG: triphosphoribosyl-dephospho-CoA synthase [Candidatus Thorarchaeota archaeon]
MPSEGTDFIIKIKSIPDLVRASSLASLLEVAGWPKPGNVHRTQNFKNTRFEHFLAGIVAIQPNFNKFLENINQFSFINKNDYKKIELGLFFKNAAEVMIKWQSGGNVILGHILILAPLVSAATICLKIKRYKLMDLQFTLNQIIENSTAIDTVNLYQAIRISSPGGLGNIDKYDIYDDNSFNDIIKDDINLKKIFVISKDYDLISSEYSTNFNIILYEGLPYFVDVFNRFDDINIATVNTYLKLLSLHPDTLVIRKSGLEIANYISKKALDILENGGISTDKGLALAIALDKELQEKMGKLNPGTTADLISGVIFCALLFGLRF